MAERRCGCGRCGRQPRPLQQQVSSQPEPAAAGGVVAASALANRLAPSLPSMGQHDRAKIGCAGDSECRKTDHQRPLACRSLAALRCRQTERDGLHERAIACARPAPSLLSPPLRRDKPNLFTIRVSSAPAGPHPKPNCIIPAGALNAASKFFCNVTNWTRNVATTWPVCVFAPSGRTKKVIRRCRKRNLPIRPKECESDIV